MRSGVVAQSDQGPPGTALLFLKGAPDVIRHMVQPASVPPDFQQVIDTMHVMTQSQCLKRPCLGTVIGAVELYEMNAQRRQD